MNEERRDEHTTVIMPTDILGPSLEDPSKLELNLDRTKKYVKKMLDRPMDEVWKEINDQMAVLMLAMRDASLKWLEVWTNSQDARSREEAKHHFVSLTNEVAKVSDQRQILAKAFGLNITGEIAPDAPNTNLPMLYEPAPKLSKEEFEKMFLPMIPKPVVADHRVNVAAVTEPIQKKDENV